MLPGKLLSGRSCCARKVSRCLNKFFRPWILGRRSSERSKSSDRIIHINFITRATWTYIESTCACTQTRGCNSTNPVPLSLLLPPSSPSSLLLPLHRIHQSRSSSLPQVREDERRQATDPTPSSLTRVPLFHPSPPSRAAARDACRRS